MIAPIPASRSLPPGDLAALVAATIHLFDACLMPNGALVEAPSHLPAYPVGAPDRLRCRPGLDAAFAILAMDALGRDVRSPLLGWVGERAAGFADDGLLCSSYAVSGAVLDDRRDLLGTALLLFSATRPGQPPLDPAAADICRNLASAIATRWDADERRFRDYPDYGGAPGAVDLVAAETALRAAAETQAVDAWTRLADSIRPTRDAALAAVLREDRLVVEGASRDAVVTACLALAWPFAPADRSDDVAHLAERAFATPNPSTRPSPDDERAPLSCDDALRPVELFWLAAGLAAANQPSAGRSVLDRGMATADAASHLPMAADPADLDPSPRPYLLSHLSFIVSADALSLLPPTAPPLL